MKDQYRIQVQTKKSLGEGRFASSFLRAWLSGNPKLRPERFGHGEPVRKSIDDVGFADLLEEWRKPPSLLFKRISAPKFVAEIKWREYKGKDPRPYPWGINAWLDLTAKDELAIEFFEFLIDWFDPAFASMTTTEDARLKHFVTYPYYKGGKLIGTAESFVGSDVGETLPGIYWLTYLTPGVIHERVLAKLGDNILHRHRQGGYLVRAYEHSSDIGSEIARSMECEIKSVLGVEHFFDVNNWKPPKEDTVASAGDNQVRH